MDLLYQPDFLSFSESINIKYTSRDFMKLAEILEEPYDEMGSYPWKKFMKEWIREFEQNDLIELIINCFFTLYGPSNITKSELKEMLCTAPLFLLGQYLLPEPSIEDPISIFAVWRIFINK
jgi:hypothetical protein